MDYNAVNAKIKAMKGRAQPVSIDDDYNRICLFLSDVRLHRLLSLDKERDYVKAWSSIKALNYGQNRSALTHIKGAEIDMQNILRIYRLKKHYPKAEIYPHLIPVFYRINKDVVKQMAESAGVAEFIVAVRHTCYGKVFGAFESPEEALNDEMGRVFSKMEKRYPRSLSGVLGYFFKWLPSGYGE